MPWAYIVECNDGTFYTGSTALEDPSARVWEHDHDDARGANYTRRRRPVTLVFAQHFERIDEAYVREKQVQNWSQAKKRALIASDWQELVRASTGKSNPRSSRQAR